MIRGEESADLPLASVLGPAALAVPAHLDDSRRIAHLPFAQWLVDRLGPRTVVHLGGDTAFYLGLCEAARAGTRLWAVGAGEELERLNPRFEPISTLLEGSAVAAASAFAPGDVGLLDVGSVPADVDRVRVFESWRTALADGAVVLVDGIESYDDARRLWAQLDTSGIAFTHGGGLGVAVLGGPPPRLVSLLEAAADEASVRIVRDAYARLGGALRDRALVELRVQAMPREARVRELETEVRWLYDSLIVRSEQTARLQERLDLLESSTVFRLSGPLRRYFARHPLQRRVLRTVVRTAWRGTLRPIVRRRRGAVRSAFEPDRGYDRWVAEHDRLTDGERVAMDVHARQLGWTPTISVVMPVCDPPVGFLGEAIDSVRGQIYPHWELCICDDRSRNTDVRALLDDAAAADDRIKVVHLEERGGISAASNAAAALATGEYIALLDHDDVLRPHALLLVADELNRRPDPVLVYSDEDKLDENGRRCEHHFKPGWNPALILSQNYVTHLAVLRRSRFEEIGGFRSSHDFSQDWDLVLRATEGVPPSLIRHIPHVLYHWRQSGSSSAQVGGVKPAALTAARSAVEDALDRRGAVGAVSTVHEYQRVRYAIPAPAPGVHVVMPSACKLEFLEPCLDGLLNRTAYDDLRVTLVVSSVRFEVPEQASYLERVGNDARVRVLVYEDRPYNFSWLNNHAIEGVEAPLLLLMNDDLLVIHEDWLEAMVGHVVQEGVGAVGAKLVYPDNTVQHGGVILGGGGIADHYHRFLPREHPGYHARAWLDQDLSCVTAACMLLRREAFDSVGGFDEELAVAFNDVDLCIRLGEAGWRIVWTPSAELYHRESVSVGRHNSPERQSEFEREERLMVARWGDKLLSDRHYNPNLSLRELNAPSFPPRVDYPWRVRVEESRSAREAHVP